MKLYFVRHGKTEWNLKADFKAPRETLAKESIEQALQPVTTSVTLI